MDYMFDKLKDLPFINEIWFFGSRARGDHNIKSDIDFAIISKNCTENV